MTSFHSIFNGIYCLYSKIRIKVWHEGTTEAAKRGRDALDEDEEDDVILSCQIASKRPRWRSSSSSFNQSIAMELSSSQSSLSSGSSVKMPTPSPVESRPPLSNLTIRAKPRTSSTELVYNDSASQTSQRNHFHDKRQNGVHSNLMNTFTSSLRMSKNSVVPKQTALNETFKLEERMIYSQMLADYHRSPPKNVHDMRLSKSEWPLRNNVLKPASLPKYSRSLETIDLTKTRTRVNAKPFQDLSASSDDDDVKVVSVIRVNSMEGRLSQNSLVSPKWISEMQMKYSEKEREKMRQVEEAKIKKEMYAIHNQKCIEALDERIRRHLAITDVELVDTEEIPPLPEITACMNAIIDAAFRPTPQREVLVTGFGQNITRQDIQTLHKLSWLNDEIINFYMNLLIERGKEDTRLSVYAFNTFFYPKILSSGYNSLRRWTKKVDIFSYQFILIPVHLGMHWCLATIDFRDRTVRYYDSMGSNNDKCLKTLLQYLVEESLDKKQKPFDLTGWRTENVKDIPQQMNGSDCGMFSCMFAEFLSRNAKITFSQANMPYFRRKMVYEIISKKIL